MSPKKYVFSSRERRVSVTGSATFIVELEVRASGRWSQDTTHAQIDTQVLDEAAMALRRLEEFARSLGIGVRITKDPVLVRATVEYATHEEA